MVNLPRFTIHLNKFKQHVGKYTIHGAYGIARLESVYAWFMASADIVSRVKSALPAKVLG